MCVCGDNARSKGMVAPLGPARDTLTRAAAERRLYGRRAETNRCGSADNSCALTGEQSGEKQDKVETEASGQKKEEEKNGWEVIKKENSDVFDEAGPLRPEFICGLGLQLLPQVYGLLYARPSSTICVSWATEVCLQAPSDNTRQPPPTTQKKRRKKKKVDVL